MKQSIGRECSRAEEEVKQFAGCLYMLHLITGYLRTVTTLWASLVILSGFGNALAIRDFWFSTAVLLLNKMSIFNTKYHVDDIIEHSSTSSPTRRPKGGILSYIRRKGRDQYNAINPRLFPIWRIMMMVIIMVKLTAAMYLCINTFLVPARVLVANGEDRNTTIARNKKYSLVVLYVLVCCECFFFLVEDLYYLYKVYLCKQLCKLSEELEFGKSNTQPVRGFLFDSISSRDTTRDMVTFAVDLLASNSREKQLVGVRIIEKMFKKMMLSSEVLRNIGDNITALNNLGRMLKWQQLSEDRISAATVLTNLAKEKENALRIATILGPIKSISYLFDNNNHVSFIDLGLRIIEELAHDQDECEKIGKTKCLLDKLVALTQTINYDNKETIAAGDEEKTHAANQQGQIVRLKKYSRLRNENDTAQERSSNPQERCFKVLKLVTTQRGANWKNLQREISGTNLVKHIRDILLVTAGINHSHKLQKLGIQVIANLAQEKHAKEHVGATEGVLEALLNIFFTPILTHVEQEKEELRCHTGKALESLALKSKGNCLRILRLEISKSFEVALTTVESLRFRLSAARLLLYLCKYGGPNFQLQTLLRSISPMVLKGVFDNKDGALQDVMVEIAGFSFKLVKNLNDWIKLCELAGVKEATLGCELKRILMRHKYDISMKHSSNICAPVVELVLWMMRIDPRNMHALRELGINQELKDILETTPKIEEAIALLENHVELQSNQEHTYLTSPTSSKD